jgi:hypothetical protein
MIREEYRKIVMMRGQPNYYYLCDDYFDYISDVDKRFLIYFICIIIIVSFT